MAEREFGSPSVDPIEPPLEVDPDDDLVGLEPGSTTMLDDIEAELTADVDRTPISRDVPGRPGYKVEFSTDIDAPTLAKWQKASRDRSFPDGTNEYALALRVLANTCQAIYRQGEQILDRGAPLTFRSKRFLDLYKKGRVVDAVAMFYGVDAHVISTAREVLNAAGYGDEIGEGEDPT